MRILSILTFILMFTVNVFAVDLNAIAQIESSNNHLAFNKSRGARGLYQITPICLKDYNKFHAIKYTNKDLFDKVINRKVADWYLHNRIPELLKSKRKEVNLENTVTCYNAGIKYVGRKIPRETKKYINKYYKLTRKV